MLINEYLAFTIYLQKSGSIQPRTSRPKFADTNIQLPWVISSALWTDPISPWGTYTKYDTTYDTHDTKFPSPLNRPAPRQKPSTWASDNDDISGGGSTEQLRRGRSRLNQRTIRKDIMNHSLHDELRLFVYSNLWISLNFHEKYSRNTHTN